MSNSLKLVNDDRMSDNLTGVYLVNLVCVKTKEHHFL